VLGMTSGAAGAADGINRMIMVTQMKAANANDDALQGAEQQRELLKQQQQLRERQNSLESQDRMGNFEIQRLMSQYNQSEQRRSNVQKKHDDTSNAAAKKFGG
jgi:cell division protein FtsN